METLVASGFAAIVAGISVAIRNTLIRTKTIGNGDKICDFHVIERKH